MERQQKSARKIQILKKIAQARANAPQEMDLSESWPGVLYLLMRFHLVDRVNAHEPGKFLRGSKFLALGEEYLADHFPRFPVMPGVLMLQTLVEAATWLRRVTEGFKNSVIVLRETKNVKYGGFMTPGRRLDIAVDLTKIDGEHWTFRGKGTDDTGRQTVAAVFTIFGYSLAQRGPAGLAADEELRKQLQARWSLITGELKPEPWTHT